MIERLNDALSFNAQALLLRAERTRVLASNIANADTPNYKARDFDFRAALSQATGVQMSAGGSAGGATAAAATLAPARTAAGHQAAAGGVAGAPALLYRAPLQTALDANTVDMDMERAAFADNTVRYEAGLRFINGQIRTLMTAINGQS
jgi:flagellar basal-body rod protein FlgB